MKAIFPLKDILLILLIAFFVVVVRPAKADAAVDEQAPGRKMAQQATKDKSLWITADHSKHSILQKDFKSGPEVTEACLSCHTEAAFQFHKTIHWTWLDPSTTKSARLGKGGLSINNF